MKEQKDQGIVNAKLFEAKVKAVEMAKKDDRSLSSWLRRLINREYDKKD